MIYIERIYTYYYSITASTIYKYIYLLRGDGSEELREQGQGEKAGPGHQQGHWI